MALNIPTEAAREATELAAPATLTYAWSDGRAFTTVDQAAPDNARERAIARALLVHALTLIDERDNPMRSINGSLLAMPCAETNHD